MADLRVHVSAVAACGSGFLHAHPRLRRRSAELLRSHDVSVASYLREHSMQIDDIRERLTRLETSCLCDAKKTLRCLGSCTCILRLIRCPAKPGKIPSFLHF